MRNAIKARGAPLDGKKVRDGYRMIKLDDARLAQLGAKGLMPPLVFSAKNHGGMDAQVFQTWDGAKVDDDLELGAAGRADGAREDRGVGEGLSRAGEDGGAGKVKREILLRLEGVEVAYNGVIRALRGVSLEVAAGSAVAILGANGAGQVHHAQGDLEPSPGRTRARHQGSRALALTARSQGLDPAGRGGDGRRSCDGRATPLFAAHGDGEPA